MKSDCTEALLFKWPAYLQYLIKNVFLFALTFKLKWFKTR